MLISWCCQTNYVYLNRGSIKLVDVSATYRPGTAGTHPLVIPLVVANGSNSNRR